MSSNEARDISINVKATQAIRDLTKMGIALESMGGSIGKSDAELRKLDRQLSRVPDVAQKAARTIAQLKNEINTMSKQQTAAGNSIKSYEQRLITANKKLQEQQQIVRTQKSLLQQLIKDNLSLAGSYNQIATAAGGATTAQTKAALRASPAATGTASDKQLANQARGMAAAVKDIGENVQWNSLRYQLYDVAATFGIVGAAALGTGLAVAKTGIEWDKNFANVVRTSQVTGRAVEWLKDEFLDLQSIIPVTSADLAIIGTLGAQMGVAAANLARFTEVTAKFSATSGLNVEESATALSRLDQLLPDVRGNYELLGSTILRTGVNAVATEAQIVRGTSQIASMGQIAGLTTPEVVALSSAMSSLGFSPELQRSVITSSFSKILTATSAVTAQTEKFGAVLGMTGKQFQEAWRSDAVGTYRDLLETIAGRGDAVTVLQDLGLASQRLTPNLLKLGQNTEVLNAALADTRDEWGKNTEMSRQYSIIADTVSARIQVLGQSWEALLVTLDDSDVVLKPVLDGLTWFLKMLRQVAKTPGASTIAGIAGAVVTLTGVLALGAAALAGMSAGYIAIINATAGLSAVTAQNTASTVANTAAQGGNAAVRGAATAALGAQTGATAANTAATGANAIALTGAQARLFGFTSSVIGALPAIIQWTSLIGLAAVSAAALGAVVMTAPDWMHDLDKAFNGIDTPDEVFAFDTKKLKASTIDLAEYRKTLKWFREENERQSKASGPRVIDSPMAAKLGEADVSRTEKSIKAVEDDIIEQVNALTSVEDKYAAINQIAKELGITQEEVLNKRFPELGISLGEGAAAAAEMQEEVERLGAAQEKWAVLLGTSEGNLASLTSSVKTAAESYLDFGSTLSDAYDKDASNGEGFGSFVRNMNSQIANFEKFYADLGTLTQRGGVQLAALFASQGPEAAQALTDSLKLDEGQIAQIESQMSLAAFYASEEFANTFAQNNAILAQVWKASGNNPATVKAFNDALASSMKGGSIDPSVLAGLSVQFGIDIPVGVIPDPNFQAQYDAARALLGATITPIDLELSTKVNPFALQESTTTVTNWVVEMENKRIVMDVDPNTYEGREIIAKWRADESAQRLTIHTKADTSGVSGDLDILLNKYTGKTHFLKFKVSGSAGSAPTAATGGLLQNGEFVRKNYPGFASGTIFRGPGSGTSDSILARVSNGEAITKARAVRFYGTRMMDDINHMRFPRYATGGFPNGRPGGDGSGSGQQINVNVTQNYPTTQDPIKTLKQDAEAVLAGIWT